MMINGTATSNQDHCYLPQTIVDKYTYSSEEYINAGALLAAGLINAGVRTEADAALALLTNLSCLRHLR
jgi:hypothetical protein